jgi:hypothetical protein
MKKKSTQPSFEVIIFIQKMNCLQEIEKHIIVHEDFLCN